MNQTDRQVLCDALAQIGEIATAAVKQLEEHSGTSRFSAYRRRENSLPGAKFGCVIKPLPKRLLVKAAATARKINPVNAPAFGPMAVLPDGHVLDPLRIAVVTSKYWGPSPRTLSVSFMESTPNDLKTRILSHMNAWASFCCISFAATDGTGDVRISREPGGYWSYLGTDILQIPSNRQTMNLEGFSMSTPESEYHRVVRHETGHTLGFPHEHMRKELVDRIDPEKAYKWFWDTQGWDKATVDAQVLTPLDDATIMGTPVDDTSIMCYQLPGAITKDGEPIPGGTDINSTDSGFAAKIYPKPGQRALVHEEGWAETEDVEVSV